VWKRIALVLAGIAVAGGLFALGRASADKDDARTEGYSAGRAAGLREGKAVGLREGRGIGIRAGRAAGVREGRALQLGESAPVKSLPRGSRRAAREAFEAAYAAGANDVFGGFDGGWSLSTPYVITLRRGSGAITYRIDSREPLRPGTTGP
jgi:hypothetical protein